MKILFVLALAALAYAEEVNFVDNTVYGYIQNYAIPLAKKIREAEQRMAPGRVVGGNPSTLGAIPYQVCVCLLTKCVAWIMHLQIIQIQLKFQVFP